MQIFSEFIEINGCFLPKYIVGTKFVGHDTNVCVVDELGHVVMAIEEERLDRNKHSAEFPFLGFQEAFNAYGVDPSDVIFVATPFCHELFYDRIDHMKKYFEETKSFDQKHLDKLEKYEFDSIEKYLLGGLYLQKIFPNAKLVDVRHHLTHAASAYYCSPFDDAAILSIDANGEIETTMLGIGKNGKIEQLESVAFPHSLGFLYEYVSEWLGLGRLEGPGKTMGLASYGKPKYLDIFLDKIIQLDENAGTFRICPEIISESPPPLMNIGFLTELFGRDPKMADTAKFEEFHADIAATIQQVAEMVTVSLARRLKRLTGMNRLCLCGGVALNCVANEKIYKQGGFDEIFIQPASNDGGSGMGAALYVYHHFCDLGSGRKAQFQPYCGSSFGDDVVEETLLKYDLPVRRMDDVEGWTAEKLAEGWLIAWCQGGAELGPRALGNRSILADPTKAHNKDLINARIKYREWWRPFAPVVLYEYAADYFDLDIESPYMLMTGLMLNDKIPAASHVDNTARVQTVRRSQNLRLYDLISKFAKISGVPVLLNTSFNIGGEPLVRTPDEAFNCLFRGGLDAVVWGDYVVLKGDCDPDRHVAVQHRITGRPAYEEFVVRTKEKIAALVPAQGDMIEGTDAFSRLLFINVLKSGGKVEGFFRREDRYLDTLGRDTLYGRRIIG